MLLFMSAGVCCCLLIHSGQSFVSGDCTGVCCLISPPKDGIRDKIATPQQPVPFLCHPRRKSSFGNTFSFLLCILLLQVESSSLGLPGNDICPAGHFCPSGTGYPVPCPPGTFSTLVGLQAEEQCQPCPAGRYCSGAGLADLAQTLPCNAGYSETVAC